MAQSVSILYYSISLCFIAATLAAVRIGSINGQFIANPTRQQMEKSDLNLVVSVNPKGHLGRFNF